MEPPFRENLRPEAEEQPLLEAVIRQLLEKTLQAGKDSVSANNLLGVWKLAMAL
jgi:hypothetical protein